MNKILEAAIEEARALPSAAPRLTPEQIQGVKQAKASRAYADPNDVRKFFLKSRA